MTSRPTPATIVVLALKSVEESCGSECTGTTSSNHPKYPKEVCGVFVVCVVVVSYIYIYRTYKQL